MTSESEISEPHFLQYAVPRPAPPLWEKWAAAAGSVPILAMFLLGLPPLAGSLDYTRDIPLSGAVAYAWRLGVSGTLRSRSMIYTAMFAPAAIAGLVTFLCVRGVWPRRVTIAANLLLPALWLGPYLPIVALVGPVVLWLTVFGQSDGETWSEGFVSYTAMGTWSLLWAAVAILLLVARGSRKQHPGLTDRACATSERATPSRTGPVR
jgi:hypothetical protein